MAEQNNDAIFTAEEAMEAAKKLRSFCLRTKCVSCPFFIEGYFRYCDLYTPMASEPKLWEVKH